MDKHRTNVFIALVLVLLIVAAILAWITGSRIVNGAPVTSNDNNKPAATQSVPSAPVNENKQTEAPVDTPEPTGRTVDESGSIKSDTGANINMRVDWHVTSASDTELTLDVEVYICSYAINAGPHSGVIRICGKDYTFLSEAIVYDDNTTMNEELVYDVSVTVPADLGETVAIPISASWDFDGVYGGRQVNRITAEQTLTVQG